MHVPAHRQVGVKRYFVFALILSLLSFAVWLKMLPNLESGLRANNKTVKLWMDPSHDSDSHVKMAPAGSFFFILLLVPAVLLKPTRPLQSIQSASFAVRDIFIESRHWFRPPPLF